MVRLHEPLRIGRRELKNRLIRAATSERLAGPAGECTDELIAFLRRIAAGGAGGVVTGHAFAAADGRSTLHQLGLHADACVPGLARLARTLHEFDCQVVVQIDHCGLLGHRRINGVGPFGPAVPPWIDPAVTRIREMTEADIHAVITSFGAAARRALEAGCDGIELRAGQGTLLHQFLSPRTNSRTDRWGGEPANRARIVVDSIRQMADSTLGELALWVQINADDGVTPGLSTEDAAACAALAGKAGATVVELSAGVADQPATVLRPVGGHETEAWSAWTVRPFRAIEGLTLMATGGIRSAELVDVLLNGKRLDLLGLARPFVREPDLAGRMLRGLPPRCESVSRCATQRGARLQCRYGEPPAPAREDIVGVLD